MFTVVLDNVRSCWNVGSILRTCDALGFELILLGYTPQPVGQTLKLIQKTALGAEKNVPWQYFEHWQALLGNSEGENGKENCLHLGIEINSTSQDLFAFLEKNAPLLTQKEKIFLWFGNEVHGLETDLLLNMDQVLHLPMNGNKESLNIATSVSAAGYLFQFAKNKTS